MRESRNWTSDNSRKFERRSAFEIAAVSVGCRMKAETVLQANSVKSGKKKKKKKLNKQTNKQKTKTTHH